MKIQFIQLNLVKMMDIYGAFTPPDSDSDKVSDSDNISVHCCGTQIRIGSRIGIGIGQCAHTVHTGWIKVVFK